MTAIIFKENKNVTFTHIIKIGTKDVYMSKRNSEDSGNQKIQFSFALYTTPVNQTITGGMS